MKFQSVKFKTPQILRVYIVCTLTKKEIYWLIKIQLKSLLSEWKMLKLPHTHTHTKPLQTDVPRIWFILLNEYNKLIFELMISVGWHINL